MSLTTLLVIALIVLLILSLPRWEYSRSWGYSPVGIIVAILVVMLVLLVLGVI